MYSGEPDIPKLKELIKDQELTGDPDKRRRLMHCPDCKWKLDITGAAMGNKCPECGKHNLHYVEWKESEQ